MTGSFIPVLSIVLLGLSPLGCLLSSNGTRLADGDCDCGDGDTDTDSDLDAEDADQDVDVDISPLCRNGFMDGDETDVDCGGPDCPACGVDALCLVDTDCDLGVCAGSCRRPYSCSELLTAHAGTADGVYLVDLDA